MSLHSWMTFALVGTVTMYIAGSVIRGEPVTLRYLTFITGISGPSCDSIIPEILKMSHEQDYPATARAISSITPMETVHRTESDVTCIGMATWTDGYQVRIRYKVWEDHSFRTIEYEEII